MQCSLQQEWGNIRWSPFGSLNCKEMLLPAVSFAFNLESTSQSTPKQLLVTAFFKSESNILMIGSLQEYSGRRREHLDTFHGHPVSEPSSASLKD